jgi:GT2 family glycosyltransferase
MVNSDEDLARAIREGEILAAENQRLQSQLREATEKYAAMRDSLSWRLTAPLRSALDLLLALRGKTAAIDRPLELNDENYRLWIAQYDRLADADRVAIRACIARFAKQPLLSLVLIVKDPPADALRQTMQSIMRQIYREWELCLLDDGSSAPHVARTLSALGDDPRVKILRKTQRDGSSKEEGRALAAGEFIGFLEAGDVLAESALFEIAAELEAYPDTELIYSDEDELDVQGQRRHPSFKTGWNPDLLLGQDYVGQLAFYRRGLAGAPSRVRHVAAVLCHRSLAKSGAKVPVRPLYPTRAKVSVIIPTRDRADLLERCVEGLLHRTDYPELEIIAVDNGSKEQRTLQLFEKYALHVVPFPDEFNWSAMNNAGARAAAGEVLLFLNNDTDVMEPGWLKELAGHAMRREVGAVGAKLLFADGTVQHAGIWLGPGIFARHLLRLSDDRDEGYLGQLSLTRNLSAVTGACMAMRRQVFDEVGGFDESFPVSYSDIDLCLKLRQRGYRVVWTPHAKLLHLESASRGSGEWRWRKEEADLARFRERWGKEMDEDPFFNPNLELIGEEKLALAFPPRRKRRWR